VIDREYWLQTERLALRRFTPDDYEWLVSLYSDAEVMRYGSGVKSREQVMVVMQERILDYYDANPGLGVWQTVERSTGSPIGFHVLNKIQGESIIQVGYFLLKPAWSRGFATEMARALLRYGFVDLGLPHIAGMTERDNVASQHVLTKIGLRRNGERAFPHPAYAHAGPMAWFEREAADWIAEHEGRPSHRHLSFDA
jgi:[ribosomal protein S5]-alanine N-acetyltransferase